MTSTKPTIEPSQPFTIIIYGGSGDLSLRKLLPSLYNLESDGYLHKEGRIIVASRKNISNKTFFANVKSAMQESLAIKQFDENSWDSFKNKLSYMPLDITIKDDFKALKIHVEAFSGSSKNCIHYMATSPHLFGITCKHLSSADLIHQQSRIVLEKPIGNSLASFIEIDDEVSQYFSENQIFRIDHYLGKETVQNLLAIRFANSLFEPLWNNQGIDHVQITVAETVSVKGREAYYGRTGALRDMVQNHILQLLCLVAMEPPNQLNANSVRDEKLKVLKSLRPIENKDIQEKTVRGMYSVGSIEGEKITGYVDLMDDYAEKLKEPIEYAETFVALEANIDNWRWDGVPFYLRTGKCLPTRYSEIVIFFKKIPHSIFSQSKEDIESNKLVIRLQPDESIDLHIINKVPSLTQSEMQLRSIPLNISLSNAFDSTRKSDAYERLLLDVIDNTATLFMRRDEVEAAWQWIDNITQGWQQMNYPTQTYSAGTWGPTASVALPLKRGRTWHE